MNNDLMFPCVRNGHYVQLPFPEAHSDFWSLSIGYLAVLHCIRFRLKAGRDTSPGESRSATRRRRTVIDQSDADFASGPTAEHQWKGYLLGRVPKGGWDFGMKLMTRGRMALSLNDARRIYSNENLGTSWFQARGSRLGLAFPYVPPVDRPYRYLLVPEYPRGFCPAYQMHGDVTWILIFRPKDLPDDFDWEVFLTPP
jgi:hypothetical protein